VTTPGTLAWFAQHEFRLTWRDWLSMMTGGKPGRERMLVVALVGFAAGLHVLAYTMVARHAGAGLVSDKTTLVVVTGSGLLSWLLMLSQAMESVTRAFYARSDLDLILASPLAPRKVFSVRIAAIAISVIAMATLIAAPFINVLTVIGGARWLCAYGVTIAMGAAATALAVALTVALFRLIGPKSTRLIAQIAAAVIGAGFVIGLQAAAILSYGTMSRLALLQSDAVLVRAPGFDSPLWWPARAILGDPVALAAVAGVGLALLGGAILLFAPRFGEHAIAAAGVAQTRARQRRRGAFRRTSAAHALRRKEWALLRRDPWLMSQTLMQILYLVPPALLLWLSIEHGTGALIVVVPVLVMAAGQLAGGLAWLAVSGEDAPDLMASAPVPPGLMTRAKIEAVLGCIAFVFAPFVIVLAIASPSHALVTATGIVLSAVAASQIQLWFRAQAKRSQFRRRHTSSRIATFAEAFSSIAWAATTALAAAGSSAVLIAAAVAIIILLGARLISPVKSEDKLARH
jgi:ABC-2 type transport system permease protein